MNTSVAVFCFDNEAHAESQGGDGTLLYAAVGDNEADLGESLEWHLREWGCDPKKLHFESELSRLGLEVKV